MKTAADDLQLVICGLGGQGAVFLSRLLAEAAMEEGREVLTAETHGMAQRGGAVEAFLKIGGFFGSGIRPGRADLVLVLDEARLEAGRRFLRAGGACFVNGCDQAEGAHVCDASGIARDLGSVRATNLVLLGFAMSGAPGRLPAREAILAALERLAPAATTQENREALEAGIALV